MGLSGTRTGTSCFGGTRSRGWVKLTLWTRRVCLRPLLPYSYVMGSITRIACQNFVTYNHVEFNPGP